jgi:broad specificity phosphatase PhoE
MQHFDAALTPYGIEQCEALALKSSLLSKVDLLVTSPLTRCIQTASIGFPTQQQAGVPFIALESVRETVNFSCDRRCVLVLREGAAVSLDNTIDDL